MYRTITFHINDDDQVNAQREDDKLWITILPAAPQEYPGEAVEIFVDPVHFAELRKAMDLVDARNNGSKAPKDGDI